jgi:hypothetical protein
MSIYEDSTYWDFSFYIKQCKDIFGDAFDLKLLQESVYDTNINYGGYSYQGNFFTAN